MSAPSDHGQPIQPERVVRVFISSTFRDMMRERDLLVKEVFPELRRTCARRFVTFTEVDLRWGITEAQANEGQVLPLCLAEIERSRPYFIGLLGERYGWIPDTIRPDVVAREPWLQEHLQERTSVTELEILHGVLNNPKMQSHAFFYFRDPSYVNDRALTDDERRDMVERDIRTDVERYGPAEAARRTQSRKSRLAALKQRIRDSKLPLVEPYADPKALAEIVRRQFGELIDRLYPEDRTPDLLTQERAAHEAHARNKLFSCIDRPTHTAALNAYATPAEHDGKGFVVTGESGGGKTALLAAWARDWARSHQEDFLFQHYFGATPESASPEGFLRRLLGELKSRFGIGDDIPADPDKLRDALPVWLAQTAGKGRIVLVLDGLNQVQGGEPDRHLLFLPRHFPPHVVVLASALPGPALDALRERGWVEHELPPASQAEADAMVGEYLAIHARALEPDLRHQLVTARGASNPLFLRTVLEELRQFGSFERLSERVSHYLEAAGPKELFLRVIERWQQDFDGKNSSQDKASVDLVRRALIHLWAARQGLSESEWLDLLGDGARPLPRVLWTPLFLALEPHLSQRAGLYTFGHDFVRQAVKSDFLAAEADTRAAHMALAAYFNKEGSFSARKVAELPWHWKEAREWSPLTDLLKDVGFVSAAWDRGYFELEMYWAAVRANTGVSPGEAYQALVDAPERLRGTGWQILRLLRDFISAADQFAAPLALCDYLIAQEHGKGNTDSLRRALAEKSVLLWGAGDRTADWEICRELESLARESGDHHRLQIALDGQANLLAKKGNIGASEEKSREAEKVCRENHNLAGLQAVLGNHADTLINARRPGEALVLLREAETISRELGHVDGLISALYSKAMAIAATSPRAMDIASVEACLTEVEDVARQFGKRAALRQALWFHRLALRGFAQSQGASWEVALQWFRRMVVIHGELKLLQPATKEDADCESDLVAAMANCAAWRCQQRDQPLQALALAEEALQFATSHRLLELADTCRDLVDGVRAWNDYYAALAEWERRPVWARAINRKPREPETRFTLPE